MSQEDEKRKTTGYVGWAIHGLYVVGTLSFIAGAYVLLDPEYNSAVGAGVCWIATALSFGLLLNGLTRR